MNPGETPSYNYETCRIAAVLAGIYLVEYRGYYFWSGNNCVNLRAAIRHAHCLTGCLDAPLNDDVGTS